MLIEEGVLEGLAGLFCQLGIYTSLRMTVFGHQQFSVEEQGVVPESVDFNYIARTGHDGMSTDFRVHPGHCALATIDEEQTVVMQLDIGVLASLDEVQYLPHQLAVLFECYVGTHQTGILLDTPDGPQEHVGLVHLVHLNV